MDETKDYTLAEIIKAGRLRRNWTLERLAGEIGVTLQLVSQWERGLRVPSGKKVIKLIKVLDLKKKELILTV